MKIVWPSDEEIEQGNRFKTYSNYLCSIASFLNEDNYDSNYSQVVESNEFKGIQGNKCRDKNKVEKLLRNAWFTEVQLNIAAQNVDFAQYSNHWAPVQLYYAVYLAIRGLFTSMGTNVRGEHASNLNAISEEIRKRSTLFPFPWRVLCAGDGKIETTEFINLPNGIKVNRVSSLSNQREGSFWDFYGLFLRTTRQRQIEKNVKIGRLAKGKNEYCLQIKKRLLIN